MNHNIRWLLRFETISNDIRVIHGVVFPVGTVAVRSRCWQSVRSRDESTECASVDCPFVESPFAIDVRNSVLRLSGSNRVQTGPRFGSTSGRYFADSTPREFAYRYGIEGTPKNDSVRFKHDLVFGLRCKIRATLFSKTKKKATSNSLTALSNRIQT